MPRPISYAVFCLNKKIQNKMKLWCYIASHCGLSSFCRTAELLAPFYAPVPLFFFLMLRQPLRSTLFPYTTLFRSKSRRGFAIQRLMNAMRQAHADGWFIVFDTLTLADDRLEAFYDNPNALRDYFRDIGRMVLAAEGRKANDSHADCYQYFCVP